MAIYKLKKAASQALRAGRQLLKPEDFSQLADYQDGDLVDLVDHRGQFLGRAYLSQQNKGLGWVFSKQPGQNMNQAFFTHLFDQAKQKRAALFADPLTTAFRVFNGDGDGLGGLSIDYYAGYLLIQWYSTGIYSYRDQILAALAAVYPQARAVIGKNRFDQAGLAISEVLVGQEPASDLLVLENGINYLVNLNEGWMTGIFLDQRDVRLFIQTELAAGRRLLNTFSYTGAFGVAAAMGGAITTTNVDVANRSQALTESQYQANGLDLGAMRVYTMDVFSYFDYAAKHGESYDIIVMDPPSFARHKKGTFKATRDYRQLVSEALTILAPQGYLVCSTNASNYRPEDFLADIKAGAKDQATKISLLQSFSLPSDFPVPASSPESDYLKVNVFKKERV
ncbi:23S rRNA (cytosine1962-C5)-methyltransferase [Aerococcus urinaehominis]|uniref:class I SAM-dependent rRNA methyltransferase n=1 Tax=Aerococcus urinaehominis TaxID=128944 RepID=UPI00088F7D1B|nr:class I SAM-dependent rRNA methyltransferase [Aerococcus urinaehominis]SDM28811.1 23S rRNA (cytosine1962-C5)-methyltransferase [Aerococcus urinaehominis]